MINIVSNNPYRILGVYANAARRDIVANKSRATAFLTANRPVEYPLDLKGIFPSLTRTLDSMNEAEAHLSLDRKKITFAQFWFIKLTPIDDIAFNHLIAGNITNAEEMWLTQESLSSLQNRLVCRLIDNNIGQALELAEKLYEKYGNEYINSVDRSSTLQMTGTELLHQFIDTLGNEVGMLELMEYELGEKTKAYIRSQTIGPLVSKISAEVSRAKNVDHKDPKARKEAGQSLMMATKEPLQQLKSILSDSDSQYVVIADKLGMEILQCGIDYYNNSEEYEASFEAMKLQKYALSVVVGQLAKERCEENVKILQKNIDNLPPNKEVFAEDKEIKKELAKFVKLPDKISHAITLLNGTKDYLQSIKQKLGSTNEYYLKISTQVVGNALHNVIEEVNAAQKPLATYSKWLGEMNPTMRYIFLSGDTDLAKSFKESERNVKSTLREAWAATIIMDTFDMDDNFKSRYRENRNTLQSLCDNMDIPTRPSPPPTPSSSTGSTNEYYDGINVGCLMGIVATVLGCFIGFANDNWIAGLFIGGFIGLSIYGKYND